MNLAILYYQLNRGVTQGIINQQLALDGQLSEEGWNSAILSSEGHDAWWEQLTHRKSIKVTFCQTLALDYDLINDGALQPRKSRQTWKVD